MSALARSRTEREGLHVSATAIRTLLECPREWFHRYVEGRAPEDVSPRLVLGVAIHEALAMFYEALRDGRAEPDAVELGRVAEAAISRRMAEETPIAFGEAGDAAELVEQAHGLIRAFAESGYRPQRVLAVEEPFALELSDPLTGELLPYEERLVGVLDLVAEDDGQVIVVDHKTAARSDAQKGERADVQMGLYAWASRRVFGEVVELRYQNVVKTKTPKVEVQPILARPEQEREAMDAVIGALELIHVAVTHPRAKSLMGRRRSWRCKECGYRRHCAGGDP